METLKNWKARRAGGRITIVGTDDTDHPSKIVGVDVIEPRDGKIIAIDRNGEEFELAAA